MSEQEPIYRVLFTQQGKLYEIYVRYISEDHLMGFIEVETFLFSEQHASVVVDPSEERLKLEFKGVKRSYIPMHAIVRIDEVIKGGPARIKELSGKADNVSHFPGSYFHRNTED